MTLRAADTQIFTLLGRLTPPANVVHIGAGTGTGYLHQWHTWDLEQAIFVDADAAKLAWAEAGPGQASNRHTITAVVGAGNEQRPFYTAGNPDENSLVPPSSLQYIWPGLKSAGQSDVQVQTLDTALESAGIPIPRDNTWLVIDCFCAADIVQGAARLLPGCSLVCARVLNTESQPEDELLHTSTLHAVTSILEPQEFRFVHLHPGLNPATGYAFYVRDWHTHALEIEKQASEQHAQQQKQAEILGQEKAALEKTIKELQEAKGGLEQQFNAGKKELEAKIKAETELRQQLAEHQQQVQQVTEQKNALQQQLTQKEQQHNETATQLKQKNDAAAVLTKERDQFKQQLGAVQQEYKQAQEQLTKLKQENDQAREQAAKLQQEKDQVVQQHAQQLKQAQEETAKLKQEKEQVSQQHAQQQKQAEILGQEKAALEKTIKELQEAKGGLEQQFNAGKKELEAKIKAETELRQQLAEHQQQVQQVTEQKNALQQQLTQKEQQHNETATQLKQKNDAAAVLTKERDQLQQQTADANHRQQLLQEELARAEAQIDLIKDLLLREQGMED